MAKSLKGPHKALDWEPDWDFKLNSNKTKVSCFANFWKWKEFEFFEFVFQHLTFFSKKTFCDFYLKFMAAKFWLKNTFVSWKKNLRYSLTCHSSIFAILAHSGNLSCKAKHELFRGKIWRVATPWVSCVRRHYLRDMKRKKLGFEHTTS